MATSTSVANILSVAKPVRMSVWRIRCPKAGCKHVSVARTDGRALNHLTSHLKFAHAWPTQDVSGNHITGQD